MVGMKAKNNRSQQDRTPPVWRATPAPCAPDQSLADMRASLEKENYVEAFDPSAAEDRMKEDRAKHEKQLEDLQTKCSDDDKYAVCMARVAARFANLICNGPLSQDLQPDSSPESSNAALANLCRRFCALDLWTVRAYAMRTQIGDGGFRRIMRAVMTERPVEFGAYAGNGYDVALSVSLDTRAALLHALMPDVPIDVALNPIQVADVRLINESLGIGDAPEALPLEVIARRAEGLRSSEHLSHIAFPRQSMMLLDEHIERIVIHLDDDDAWRTLGEHAKETGIPYDTLQRWAADGTIPSIYQDRHHLPEDKPGEATGNLRKVSRKGVNIAKGKMDWRPKSA